MWRLFNAATSDRKMHSLSIDVMMRLKYFTGGKSDEIFRANSMVVQEKVGLTIPVHALQRY